MSKSSEAYIFIKRRKARASLQSNLGNKAPRDNQLGISGNRGKRDYQIAQKYLCDRISRQAHKCEDKLKNVISRRRANVSESIMTSSNANPGHNKKTKLDFSFFRLKTHFDLAPVFFIKPLSRLASACLIYRQSETFVKSAIHFYLSKATMSLLERAICRFSRLFRFRLISLQHSNGRRRYQNTLLPSFSIDAIDKGCKRESDCRLHRRQ